MSEPEIIEDDVEVGKTKHSGWGWFCKLCDVLDLGIEDEASALTRARRHINGYSHQTVTGARLGGRS